MNLLFAAGELSPSLEGRRNKGEGDIRDSPLILLFTLIPSRGEGI
jgi:hypothetical protein